MFRLYQYQTDALAIIGIRRGDWVWQRLSPHGHWRNL